MEHVAILLAGGSGSRMGNSVTDKILVEIAGKPLFAHVVEAFAQSCTQDLFIIVARDDSHRKQLASVISGNRIETPVLYTLGGHDRQHSVKAGLSMVPSEAKWVMVHDCARGAISTNAIKAVQKTLLEFHCAVSLAHRVTDTIRRFETNPLESPARGTLLPRNQLWAMETPQAFPRSLLEQAHEILKSAVTDDLAAVEALGESVALVESLFPNPKLTRAADLPLLENLLARKSMNSTLKSAFRVGYGYDIHRFKKGRPLVLGGVRLQSEIGLMGHSDADVLSHAIADAILGGCGLNDIGHYFPNTDPSIKNISSLKILSRAREEAANAGYRIMNVDATLVAERPKIAPYIPSMKAKLASCLEITPTDIGIKATTQEQIGALGQGAGIAAHATACLMSA